VRVLRVAAPLGDSLGTSVYSTAVMAVDALSN